MSRRLAVIASAALLVPAVGAATLVAQAAERSGKRGDGERSVARQFAGYWMGIDPLDGGDSRRGITKGKDRTLNVIGRDTVFTLCDGSDRAIVTVGDARLSGGALLSDDFVITCTNTRSTVRLKVRYDVVDRNVIRETVTSQAGEPVDEIIFHRVSES
jgi:hypothetical protein